MKKNLFSSFLVLSVLILSSCFNEKNSPFYDSEWIMKNHDDYGNEYVHQIFFKPGHQLTFQSYYTEADVAVVWTGKYKINSRKIVFDIENCARLENGVPERISQVKIIKYFNGEFLYDLASPDDENAEYRLELIRPQNYFYGKNLDFLGNPMETFVRMEK